MRLPLDNFLPPLPQGRFGALRKYDVHTGIDLYCALGEPVYAIESGVVVGTEQFTGMLVGSPWWNDTWAVSVCGKSGVIVYGEICPEVTLTASVKEGDRLGSVLTVLRKNKGLPMTMLHLELYSRLMPFPEWLLGRLRPVGLLDPTYLTERKI